ncbi:hypothetical protein TN51_08685 [Xanthomonas euvesicatoria pv. citrumelonis]|nr:hypothetical protein TN51_08685 [Xanthomonas euvesicatoria pv. citrumelonis]
MQARRALPLLLHCAVPIADPCVVAGLASIGHTRPVARVARSNQAMERLDDDGRAITHMRLGILSRLFLWWQRRWD